MDITISIELYEELLRKARLYDEIVAYDRKLKTESTNQEKLSG